MRDQEQLFREHALGNFRDLLAGITRDNAMLIYLDNSYNDGQAIDEEGNRIPPNENYARELLQLFCARRPSAEHGRHASCSTSTAQPLPAYTEGDVKEVARALTGWFAQPTRRHRPGEDPIEIIPAVGLRSDRGTIPAKMVLGETVPPTSADGATTSSASSRSSCTSRRWRRSSPRS